MGNGRDGQAVPRLFWSASQSDASGVLQSFEALLPVPTIEVARALPVQPF
jgi:hypothetical protein